MSPLFPLSPDSELQVALIALFSELLYRFPNLVVAQVTRDSVQAAIANGITADQVRTPGTRRGRHQGQGGGTRDMGDTVQGEMWGHGRDTENIREMMWDTQVTWGTHSGHGDIVGGHGTQWGRHGGHSQGSWEGLETSG